MKLFSLCFVEVEKLKLLTDPYWFDLQTARQTYANRNIKENAFNKLFFKFYYKLKIYYKSKILTKSEGPYDHMIVLIINNFST